MSRILRSGENSTQKAASQLPITPTQIVGRNAERVRAAEDPAQQGA